MTSLIRGGCQPACCTAWTYSSANQTCSLYTDWRAPSSAGHDGLITGLLPSVAPRNPPPPPPPAKEGSQKNIVVLLTDDQDLRLNSMQAMPHAQRLLNHAGANLTNFWVNTPVRRPAVVCRPHMLYTNVADSTVLTVHWRVDLLSFPCHSA